MNTPEILPDSLLQLAGVRRMNRRCGVLLRHYWMPATELTYLSTSNGLEQETVVRNMVKCNSDVCIWREGDRFSVYNRSEQTFRTRGLHDSIVFPEDINDAKNQAFLQIPVLTPLLPVPIGFHWHVHSNDGYMEFLLESEDSGIVFVRRKGCVPDRFREGITAISLERSIILEDRFHDVFKDGSESQVSIKLIQSRLT